MRHVRLSTLKLVIVHVVRCVVRIQTLVQYRPDWLHHRALYLMNTSLFLTRSHLSPNLAITIFASFAVSVHTSIPKQLPPLPLPLFTPSLTTATLFITTCPSLRLPGSSHLPPELSCTCCCQSSQIQSHHSNPPVSTLAKDN